MVIGVVRYSSTALERSSRLNIRETFRSVSKKTSAAPHNKKSNVLLIWSGDWPTYSSNSDKYYVILAGEGFDSTDEAWNWCKANNYGPNDCMPIDLQ